MATIAERWLQEGIEKGEKIAAQKTALQMKKDGMDIALISKYTGLSEAEVKQLQEE